MQDLSSCKYERVISVLKADAAEHQQRMANFVVENPSLDIDTFSASHTNLGRLLRLQFVASHCPSLRAEALKLAIQLCANTYNVQLYGDLQRSLISSAETNQQVLFLLALCRKM